MADEQQMAPAAAPMDMPHKKNPWTVLGILFLVLFICSALLNAYLFMAWSNADDTIGMMDDDMVEEMEEHMDEVLDDEGAMMEESESNILDSTKDDLRGAYSYTTPIANGTRYTSSIYYFSLNFPATWGTLEEELTVDGPSDVPEQIIRISSLKDSKRYIDIYVVPLSAASDPAIVDLPAVKVGENSNYVYLISSSGDHYGMPGEEDSIYETIYNEAQGIRASFESAF